MIAAIALATIAFQDPPTRGQVRPLPPVKLDPSKLQPLQPTNRDLKFELFSLSYRKAEDEDGKDEPYLFTAGYRFTILKDVRGFFIGAYNIEVTPIGVLDHNNLGYPSDHWARSQRRYRLSGQTFTTSLPIAGGLQVAGIMTMLMEEDGFNVTQMQKLRADFPVRFKRSLEDLQKDSVRQPATYIDDLIRRIGRWIYGFQAARYIQFFIPGGTSDPDDVGGTQTAFVVNFGPNPGHNITRRGMQLVAGDWFAGGLKFTEIRQSGGNLAVNFALSYPAGNINAAPPKARWHGEAIVAGYATAP